MLVFFIDFVLVKFQDDACTFSASLFLGFKLMVQYHTSSHIFLNYHRRDEAKTREYGLKQFYLLY